ncbi:hypothetical protein TW85_25195 [Marinomonas sp. S3726]|uniref:hypothetical protein n=1 Tax=Marinomonas sp. S3726 TaxID=579484 RepID=UPI0005FA8AFC|nr:hypothetical protein [Marinomonas sp. S3726]KJZ05812.1 hypothetical protein TW85_25195 [Marinomonas sp. S3726]
MGKITVRSPKRAYAYDKNTGEFTGVVYADPDPLDVTNWLLPASSTFTVLDDAPAGHVAVFKEGEKKILVDKRGTEYFDENGIHYLINQIGEDLPENALLEKPYIPPTLDEQTKKVQNQCSIRINSKWNQIGQINAALGVYSEQERADCSEWVKLNRDALKALLQRADLTEIDVESDEFWPKLN